jgi:putative redox protein
MKARINWLRDLTFVAESGSGHAVVMSASKQAGGATVGPSPMEYVLLGTGGCTATDVVAILEKGRHKVRSCEVAIDSDRAETDPKVFTKIRFHFKVSGVGLTRDVVERAIKLSAEKYCSASAMLAKTATLSHEFEIINEA